MNKGKTTLLFGDMGKNNQFWPLAKNDFTN
jgi:hypothetical protein